MRYFASKTCISFRMPGDGLPGDGLPGASCHLEKRVAAVLLRRPDSWKAYATSSWRALKNLVSSPFSAWPARTQGALTNRQAMPVNFSFASPDPGSTDQTGKQMPVKQN